MAQPRLTRAFDAVTEGPLRRAMTSSTLPNRLWPFSVWRIQPAHTARYRLRSELGARRARRASGEGDRKLKRGAIGKCVDRFESVTQRRRSVRIAPPHGNLNVVTSKRGGCVLGCRRKASSNSAQGWERVFVRSPARARRAWLTLAATRAVAASVSCCARTGLFQGDVTVDDGAGAPAGRAGSVQTRRAKVGSRSSSVRIGSTTWSPSRSSTLPLRATRSG
jgi:hypothetical protein